ncbi:MAG TPA: GAF domain-containing protein [Chitinophagaceae bacterium]|nr:GAF domain-containing protein [Chitinophagaceae bacterium]
MNENEVNISAEIDPKLANSAVQKAVLQAAQLLNNGESKDKIFACLVRGAEAIAPPGSVSSILLLDKDGLLRNGSSPNLPFDYLSAIDGLKPDPWVGTCASAAATGSVVITIDFKSDDKWGELRHLPLALGFVGAWSMPIKNKDGKVLGTFGTYFRQNRKPSKEELIGVKQLAEMAAAVLTS